MKNTTNLQWRTSSFSDGLQCVEVAAVGDQVLVRHSKDAGGPTLTFTRGEVGAFVQGAKAGEYDDLV
ncbi:MAG TPA: DUF397 domain-containing protein [Acidimicrobiales bacterium]|jgi:hypothetical protein